LSQLLLMMADNQDKGPQLDDDALGLRRADYPEQLGWRSTGVLNVDSFLELNRLRKSLALADYMSKKAMQDDPPPTSVRSRLIASAQREQDEKDEAAAAAAKAEDDGSGVSGSSKPSRRAVVVDITGEFFNVHQIDEEEATEAEDKEDKEDTVWKSEVVKLTCAEMVFCPVFLLIVE
jgi:hypothetical protein